MSNEYNRIFKFNIKLTKNNMKPYLIQRDKIENRNNKIGIDSIIKFDYVGVSEFEWGTLPNSLKEIRQNFINYEYRDIQINNKNIIVFYDKKVKPKILELLRKLALNDFHLKEYSDFNNYIYDKPFYTNTNFWWDIENHLMFWVKNDIFTEKFKKLIQ